MGCGIVAVALVFAKPRIRVLMLSGRRHQRRVTPTFFSPSNAPKTVCRPKTSRRARPKQTGDSEEWSSLRYCSAGGSNWVVVTGWQPGLGGLGGLGGGRGLEAAPGTAVKMAIYHFVFKRGSGEREWMWMALSGWGKQQTSKRKTANQTKNQTKPNRTEPSEMK